jgi:hypothetical protein
VLLGGVCRRFSILFKLSGRRVIDGITVFEYNDYFTEAIFEVVVI